jgi:chromosome segregation ATPase
MYIYLFVAKIKYPPLTSLPENVQQGLPSKPKEISKTPTPQSSIDSDGGLRYVTPMPRQSSMPKDDNSKTSLDSYDIRSQNSTSPRSLVSLITPPPENMEGGSGGIYSVAQQFQQQTQSRVNSQPYQQQGYSRSPVYSYRQATNGTQSSRGLSAYDMNAIVMSDSKGNPPEQITYMERSISPQQRSVSPQQRSVSPQPRSIPYVSNSNAENIRKQTPSPFGNIGGILRPLIQSQRNNDGIRENNNSQQSKNGKKQSIFENPRQAPRPPNTPPYGTTSVKTMSPTPSSPESINTNIVPQSPKTYEESNYSSSTILNSPIELRSPTSDNVEHTSPRTINTGFDERDQIIAAFKKREMWFRTELALAKKSGYTLEVENEDSIPDGIDIENLLDMGGSNSEKCKVMEKIARLKQEIKRSRASIASQAQIASQKITDSERARTAALQEAVYLKAKLVAITNASESELANLEVERANDLEKRLTQALIEKENIQNKFIQAQQDLDYEKTSRESAEERAMNATTRAEEAEGAHARVLAELATLHSRATSAESTLRETKAKLTEATADLAQHRSENDGSNLHLSQLQQSVEQHKRALEKANIALTAANERTNEIESLWKQSKQDIINLEKESAGLRAELDIKMRDLERSKARTNEMERLLEKAQKESEAMRVMMQEGMTKLLNNPPSPKSPNSDTNDTLEANDKLKLKEQELSALRLINDEAQKTANEATNNLSGAMVKMLQLESSIMKARSESASLQRKLAESNDEIIRTKGRLREKERILEEKSRALEDAEVKIGMMRDVMTERGIFEEGGNFTGASMSSRFKEMESRCEELENMHAKTQAELKASIKRYKDALRKAEDAENKSKVLEEELERASNGGSLSLAPEISSNQALEDELKISEIKLSETQRRLDDTKQELSKIKMDYKTATSYVKNTEKMLRRVKDELTKSNSENVKYKQQLSSIKKQNEELEDKISELENQISLQKGFRASRQDFANVKQLVTQREEFLKEKEELNKKITELIEHAREEKLMSNQSYEALRREYDNLRKEYRLLRQTTDSIQEQFAKAEKEVTILQSELEETLSLNELLNQQLDEALKNNGNLKELNERRISTINRERWKEQRELLEKQNMQLRDENVELDRKLRQSENKITLLLDQMETAVDSYRGIEEEIRETSPRNSKIISNLANELDVLKSQFEMTNNEIDDMNDVNSRWSKVATNDLARASSRLEEYDEIMATLDAVQRASAERSRLNVNVV